MEHDPAFADSLSRPLLASAGDVVMAVSFADVGHNRESQRRRLWRLAIWVGVPTAFLWWRIIDNRPFDVVSFPTINWSLWGPMIFLVALAVVYVGFILYSRRSPHTIYRPEQLDVRMSDVVWIQPVKE